MAYPSASILHERVPVQPSKFSNIYEMEAYYRHPIKIKHLTKQYGPHVDFTSIENFLGLMDNRHENVKLLFMKCYGEKLNEHQFLAHQAEFKAVSKWGSNHLTRQWDMRISMHTYKSYMNEQFGVPDGFRDVDVIFIYKKFGVSLKYRTQTQQAQHVSTAPVGTAYAHEETVETIKRIFSWIQVSFYPGMHLSTCFFNFRENIEQQQQSAHLTTYKKCHFCFTKSTKELHGATLKTGCSTPKCSLYSVCLSCLQFVQSLPKCVNCKTRIPRSATSQQNNGLPAAAHRVLVTPVPTMF